MPMRVLVSAAGIAGLILGLVLGSILVAGSVAGMAATGRPFLLGHVNETLGTTTLRTSGENAPLRLGARPGQPPLAVGSTTKVRHLNADLLDGQDSSSFAPLRTTLDLRYDLPTQHGVLWDATLPAVPRGQYFVTYSAYLDGAVGTAADPLKGECYIVQGPGGAPVDQTFYTADDSMLSIGDPMSFSGSGVVDTTQDHRVMLECELNEGEARTVSWGTIPSEPIQVTLTPLDGYQRLANP